MNNRIKTYKRLRGTQDILPGQSENWQYVEKIIKNEMRLFNYREIRTPIFEQTELFGRGIGQLTDIVIKEMYTFKDRGKRTLTLKPEMTAPIVRAYIENTLYAQAPVTKLYYIAPMFRQENPQAGRLRQFHQFGAEVLGSSHPAVDAETIQLAIKIFNNMGLSQLKLQINSVGDSNCRGNYKKILKQYFKPLLAQYCPDCQSRFSTNPLRILDCKNKECQVLNQKAPKMTEHLCPACNDHFNQLCSLLKQNNIAFEINPYLVRGLDYYTRTVYEITSQHLGSQDAICGGGRYDLLCQQLGGPEIPAVGFAAGIERVLMVLESLSLLKPSNENLDIFLISMGETAVKKTSAWIHQFRNMGLKSDQDFLKRSIKAQMREANKQNARLVLILGEDELAQNQFTIKEMETGNQIQIPFSGIETYLKAYFKI